MRGGLEGMQASVVLAGGLRSRSAWALEHRSVVVVQGLSCPTACGVQPDQGSHPRLLCWPADSLLSRQGSLRPVPLPYPAGLATTFSPVEHMC